jgi:nitroreductase/NAD-dependent dihydropyrimidine dehydrogenase PreA subunit
VNLLNIDEEKCLRDGVCAEVCPARVIDFADPSHVPIATEDAQSMCIDCAHCVAVCPTGALSHRLVAPETCPPLRPGLALNPQHVEHLLRSRRSIRAYEERPVERDVLAKLVEIARYAPTGANTQQVKWLIVDSGDEVRRLAGLVIDMMRQFSKEGHPLAARFPMDSLLESWDSGWDRICRGAPALIIAYVPKDSWLPSVDPVIALSFLDVAAPALGLGSCWAGYLMVSIYHWPPLWEALELPDEEISLAAMLVGYPKYRYHRLPPRNEPQITWHASRRGQE